MYNGNIKIKRNCRKLKKKRIKGKKKSRTLEY